jgi:hypothetical protein
MENTFEAEELTQPLSAASEQEPNEHSFEEEGSEEEMDPEEEASEEEVADETDEN